MYHLYKRPLIHSNWYQCFQYRVLTSQPTVLTSSSQHDFPPHHYSLTPLPPVIHRRLSPIDSLFHLSIAIITFW
jgi:hypothetical protein